MAVRSARRGWRRAWRAAVVAAGAIVVWSAAAPPSSAQELAVGVAKLDLTPPKRVPLAGYSRRHGKLAHGVHDPALVRALVIRDRDSAVALASCDLLIIDERLFAAVQAHVKTLATRPIDHLLIAATHTHSGPGAYGTKFFEKISMGHHDPEVFERLATQIARAIAQADEHVQPATVRAIAVPTEGLIINRLEEGGATDPELSVVIFDGAQRAPLAIVAGFAAHPTTLGAWNWQLSADYPGVLTKLVEERYPSATCLFVAGAVGDQAPVKHGDGFERAEYIGRPLAERVIGAVERAPTGDSAGLRAVQRTVPLPPAKLRINGRAFPRSISRLFVDDDATLTVIAAGRALFIGAPCDLSAELGLALKAYARAAGYEPVVVGFADDYVGYVMPERVYWTKQYEASMAFNGPKTAERLLEELKRMIDELRASRATSGE